MKERNRKLYNSSSANKFMLFLMVYLVIAMLVVNIISLLVKEYDFTAFLLVANHIISFAVPIALYMLLNKIPLKHLASFKPLDFKNILFVIGMSILAMPFMGLISSITSLFADNQVGETILDYIKKYPFWLCFLSTAVMPAVFEELTFRGLILNGYKRMGAGIALAMSALYFGIMHTDAFQFFYATAVGFMLGAMVYYTGSIYSSMLSHLIINGSQIIYVKLILMLGIEDLSAQMEITTNDKLMVIVVYGVIAVIVLPFFVVLLMAFLKHNKGKNLDYIYDMEDLELYQNMKFGQGKAVDLATIMVVVIFILIILFQSLLR